MRLAIPLPWYSRQAYDITMDEVRGGWRMLIVECRIDRSRWRGMRTGFIFQFSIGLGTRFRGNHVWYER